MKGLLGVIIVLVLMGMFAACIADQPSVVWNGPESVTVTCKNGLLSLQTPYKETHITDCDNTPITLEAAGHYQAATWEYFNIREKKTGKVYYQVATQWKVKL